MKTAVLITASTKGLGREIASEFLKNGHNVIINGRFEEELQAVFADSENVYRFCQDMTEDLAAEKLLKFINDNGLFVDCAVNNLGGKVDGDCHPIDKAVFEKSMRLNLTAAIEINTMLIEDMKKNGGGKIFHIGSTAGETGFAAPCYAIAKGALNTYIKNAARVYAKDNITICGIIPGILDHEGSDWDMKKRNEPEKYSLNLSQMPIGRFLMPQDIAPVIYSLYKTGGIAVTGSLINITGGR